MKKYDDVIWDWNGTLLDDITLALSVVNEVLEEYGVETLTPTRYKQIFDFPVRIYYERAGLDLARHDFREISEKFCSRFEARLHLARMFPSAPPLLRQIRENGGRQFLLSSTEQNALGRMTNHYGITDLFECTQGLQDNFAEGKAGAGRTLLRRCEIRPDRAVIIGDTTHDGEVARQLGVECMLLTSGHHSHERLSTAGFPVFDSLETLSANLL
jgi:phosphoglycolate phosphatase